jgi:hypothetical protein
MASTVTNVVRRKGGRRTTQWKVVSPHRHRQVFTTENTEDHGITRRYGTSNRLCVAPVSRRLDNLRRRTELQPEEPPCITVVPGVLRGKILAAHNNIMAHQFHSAIRCSWRVGSRFVWASHAGLPGIGDHFSCGRDARRGQFKMPMALQGVLWQADRFPDQAVAETSGDRVTKCVISDRLTGERDKSLEPFFDIRLIDSMPECDDQQQGGRVDLTPAGRSFR